MKYLHCDGYGTLLHGKCLRLFALFSLERLNSPDVDCFHKVSLEYN